MSCYHTQYGVTVVDVPSGCNLYRYKYCANCGQLVAQETITTHHPVIVELRDVYGDVTQRYWACDKCGNAL